MKKFSLLLCGWLLLSFASRAQSNQAVQYEPDDSVFPNPERGWFIFKELKPTHFNNENNWASTELLSSYFDQGYRIIKHIVRIPTYSQDIPPSFLNDLQTEADLVRSQGMKIFYRFNYNWNHDVSDQDASLNVTLAHLEQLQPFFEKNKDVLCWMEMGFIGNWGEMHTSTSGHIVPQTVGLSESGKQILRKALEVFPQDRVIGVRYPQVVFRNPQSYGALGYSEPLSETTAYNGSEQARLATWYANFGAGEKLWHQDEEYVAQWAPSSRFLPQWAHCDHFQDLTMDSFEWMDDAKTFHYVSLSNPKDENHTIDIYERWLQDGVYDDYEKFLGYRYRLLNSSLNTQITTDGTLDMSLSIANDGWARSVNDRKVEVILRNTEAGKVHVLKVNPAEDFRLWFPGSNAEKEVSFSVALPAEVKPGQYEVLLNLPDPAPSIADRPEYSIRLANQDMWEPETGYNKLNATITVTAGGTTSNEPTELTEGTYELHPVSSPDKVVAVTGSGNGSNVALATDSDQSNQRWQLTKQANGYYRIVRAGSSKQCLDVRKRGTDNGTNVQTWRYNPGGQSNQEWKLVLEEAAKGYYSLAPRHAEEAGLAMRLDVAENSTETGANFHLWTSHGRANQRFVLEKVGGENARLAGSADKGTLTTTEDALVVYPNPAPRAGFQVSGVAEDSELSLYTLQGQSVAIRTETVGKTQQQIVPNKGLTKGMYVLKAQHPDGTRTEHKIVVE